MSKTRLASGEASCAPDMDLRLVWRMMKVGYLLRFAIRY